MTISRIIVGIDDSPASIAALKFAAEEATLRDVPLRIIHSWQVDATMAMGAAAIPWQDFETDAQEVATSVVAEALGDEGAAQADVEVVHGIAGQVLVAACQPDDLLVLGTRVHTGLKRMLHGSVSRHCLTHAPCAVLAVPAPE